MEDVIFISKPVLENKVPNSPNTDVLQSDINLQWRMTWSRKYNLHDRYPYSSLFVNVS